MTIADLQLSLAAGEMRDGEGFVAFQRSARGIPQFLNIDPLFIGAGFSEKNLNAYDGVRTDNAGRVTGYEVNTGATKPIRGSGLNSFKTDSKFFPRNQILHLIDYRKAHSLRGKSCLPVSYTHLTLPTKA